MKNQSLSKTIVRVSFILFSLATLYYLLNKKGYVPPINYLLSSLTSTQNVKLISSRKKLLNYNLPITEIITSSIDKSQTAMLIEKSQYRLTIYYQDQPIKSYPVVFGANPTGDKLQEGDRKTPEGIFKVRDLYTHSMWSKFIWLDYPNHDSWSKHLQAKKSGKIPLSAAIGSEIGIHGVPHNSDSLIDTQNK